MIRLVWRNTCNVKKLVKQTLVTFVLLLTMVSQTTDDQQWVEPLGLLDQALSGSIMSYYDGATIWCLIFNYNTQQGTWKEVERWKPQ